MDAAEEHITNEQFWTVEDRDGVTHRAVRQASGSITWVITACPWWSTSNVAGERAPVRTDADVTCIACTMVELEEVGEPKCKHCGGGQARHSIYMHMFETA